MNHRCRASKNHVDTIVLFGTRGFLLGFLFLTILYVGRELEQRHVRRLPGTSHLYETDQVCGLTIPLEYSKEFLNRTKADGTSQLEEVASGSNNTSRLSSYVELTYLTSEFAKASFAHPPLTSVTYQSAELVRSQGSIVQHCGDCGQCSNPQDIAIYDITKNTLFQSSLHCSLTAFLKGRHQASECLEQAVGFTEGCRDCWVDNIMCTIQSCLFTCAWTSLFSRIKVNSASPQELNECLQCDEKRCGPAFLQCAGANRRRVGISSDIQRNHREECALADEAWWRSESLQRYYQLTKIAETGLPLEG